MHAERTQERRLWKKENMRRSSRPKGNKDKSEDAEQETDSIGHQRGGGGGKEIEGSHYKSIRSNRKPRNEGSPQPQQIERKEGKKGKKIDKTQQIAPCSKPLSPDPLYPSRSRKLYREIRTRKKQCS
jgi:hypothetical protein